MEVSKEERHEVTPIPAFYGKPEILIFWCETPLHPGIGATIATGVDLPVQREVHTGYPRIQSSEVKGLLRSYIKDRAKGIEEVLFGPEPGVPRLKAGNLAITDARLLLFPVSCDPGFFVWATSYLLLNRFAQALRRKGEDIEKLEEAISKIEVNSSKALQGKIYLLGDLEIDVGKIEDENWEILLEYLEKIAPNTLGYAYIRKRLIDEGYILIVSDEVMSELTERGTEQVTRIRLKYETKTVETGGLWTEEYLPEYTVLYTEMYMATRHKGFIEQVENAYNSLISILRDARLFIAGKETTGRGLVYIRIYGDVEHV
jgi:CRISPR-associated protein Cmr4